MALPTSASTSLPSPSSVNEIAALSREAAGIEMCIVRIPDDWAGSTQLPTAITVGLVHGKEPRLQSVRHLLDEYRLKPLSKKGTARALTLESFIAMVNLHATSDSALFADTDWKKPSLQAVIDYHAASKGRDSGAEANDDTADNCAHRVRYEFPLSEEWKAWVETNGEAMNQGDFAAFLEDRIAELASPTEEERTAWEDMYATKVATPAQLMNLSRGLQVNVEARVKNTTTLQSGEGSIVFEEEHRDSDGKPVSVPGLFCLSVPPFFGGYPCRVPVRLRYRVQAGRIVWFYQIVRPDAAITARVRADLAIVASETAIPVFEGMPEA